MSLKNWMKRYEKSVPYPQLLQQHHLKVTNLIHAEVPRPFPSTVK